MPGAVLVSRLANTSAGARVYPGLLPQDGQFPAITYTQVSRVETHAFGEDASVTRFRLQVDSWGNTYAESRSLANEVLEALSRFRGTVGTKTVHDCHLDNEIELYESETNRRRVSQDYSLFLSTE